MQTYIYIYIYMCYTHITYTLCNTITTTIRCRRRCRRRCCFIITLLFDILVQAGCRSRKQAEVGGSRQKAGIKAERTSGKRAERASESKEPGVTKSGQFSKA